MPVNKIKGMFSSNSGALNPRSGEISKAKREIKKAGMAKAEQRNALFSNNSTRQRIEKQFRENVKPAYQNKVNRRIREQEKSQR